LGAVSAAPFLSWGDMTKKKLPIEKAFLDLMETDGGYYVEYSLRKGYFCIDTLENIVDHNINSVVKQISTDYIIVGGPFSMLDAIDYINSFEGCVKG
jgi:hypothetical protein